VAGVRITVLGACGAWPEAGQACSGYLVEQDGFRLLVDAGYAVMPRLLEHVSAGQVDAVFISHGHPDHCADLSPLLRARALAGHPAPPLPVYALPGALDAVLALDPVRGVAGACEVRELVPGRRLEIGPFGALARLLPHWVPNAGLRLTAGGSSLAYTGDSGPGPELDALAREASLLLAEATWAGPVPDSDRPYISGAREAGALARRARAGHLVLTHLWPGTSHAQALAAASAEYDGTVSIAATLPPVSLP
jgi:ribonuclease BN (tRNA processing enzyme)